MGFDVVSGLKVGFVCFDVFVCLFDFVCLVDWLCLFDCFVCLGWAGL